MTKSAEDIIRDEWDLLRKSGLLHQLNCSAGPIKTKGVYNMFKWKALMQAPNNSPYKGYAFQFEINFPQNYPNSPPSVICKTNVYHMNISTTGSVCVSSVKSEWNNAQNINNVIKFIFVIFKVPNPNSPHRRDIAQLYNTNMQEYEKNVKDNCEKYAIKI